MLNAGFDQIFNLYSKAVYESGDILDTFVYRLGLIDAQYGPATAVGLFKSIISTMFISVSYWLAYRFCLLYTSCGKADYSARYFCGGRNYKIKFERRQ